MSQIATTALYADRTTDAHAVGVDESKMIAAVYLVEKDVAGREVAMEETLLVKSGGKAGKLARHLFALFVGEHHHLGQTVAIVGMKADEIGRGLGPTRGIFDKGDWLGTFKTTLTQRERLVVGFLAFRGFEGLDGQATAQGQLAVAFHTEGETVHLKGAHHVAVAEDFSSFTFKMLVDVRQIVAQMLVFGIEYDFHGIERDKICFTQSEELHQTRYFSIAAVDEVGLRGLGQSGHTQDVAGNGHNHSGTGIDDNVADLQVETAHGTIALGVGRE